MKLDASITIRTVRDYKVSALEVNDWDFVHSATSVMENISMLIRCGRKPVS